ncbi:MAG: EutN/CcmL family microcompartment protein [Planctomycetes bacterium]|nr:EutN/CcmL family microcompartment protein [Planctomycetota bacterium]
MLLGRVVGTVWATRKDEKLEGLKLEIVQQTDLTGKGLDSFVIAADSVGAGLGELVLVASGSSARQTRVTKDRPVDAVIMAIVDRLDVTPEERITKDFEDRRRQIEERLATLKES